MIGFAGLSHLGIVSSIATASKQFDVAAYDPDASVVEDLSRGRLPVVEPGLPELLEKSRTRLRFSADASILRQCEVIYVSFDVPTGADNRSELSFIHGLLDVVVAHASPSSVLVVLSQVPPGFTRELARRLGRSHPGLRVLYQVETLIFGRAVERALYPERYIVGCGNPAEALPEAYAGLLGSWDCPILPMRYESAELAKISVNMFLASSVCVTNTLAELCEAIGAEWSEILPALKLDKRIGAHAYLNPGLGLAGGNLERDLETVRTLAREFGTDAVVVDAWLDNSCHRRGWVLGVLHAEVLSRVGDPIIAIWGLAYKANTASTKNSPALDLLDALKPFTLRVYDPEAVLEGRIAPRIVWTQSAREACREADALAIMTPWAEFSRVEIKEIRELMRGRVIVDPFHVLDQRRCVEAGFRHFALGSLAGAPENVA